MSFQIQILIFELLSDSFLQFNFNLSQPLKGLKAV